MSRRREQLSRLAEVTELGWSLAAARLAEKAALERAAEARLHALRQDREAAAATVAPDDMLHRQVLAQWSRWADVEAARLGALAARARHLTEAERAAAAKALARKEAAAKLLAVERLEHRRRLARLRGGG